MGLTIKRENDLNTMFDKFATMPEAKKTMKKSVDALEKKELAEDEKEKKDSKK